MIVYAFFLYHKVFKHLKKMRAEGKSYIDMLAYLLYEYGDDDLLIETKGYKKLRSWLEEVGKEERAKKCRSILRSYGRVCHGTIKRI